MVQGNLSILIGVISIISLWLSYRLVKSLTGAMKIPFISTFFMLNYVVYTFIGATLLNVFYFDYEVNTYVYSRPDILFNTWLYAVSGLYLIPLGMFFANTVFYSYRPNILGTKLLSQKVKIKPRDSSSLMFIIVFFFFTIALITFFRYSSQVKIPLLGVFQGLSKGDLTFLRSESGANFGGKMYRYVMLMKSLPLMLLLIVFILKNEGRKWKFFFIILLGYNIFISLIDTQKSPVLKLIILLVLAHFYLKNKVNRKVVFRIVVFMLSLMMLMYVFFMGLAGRDFLTILGGPLHRIFIGQVTPFYYYQLFQEQFGYIYGTSFPNPGGIFPFVWRRITVEVMMFAHPELIQMGIVGSMPTVFYGDWFINFGPYAALFSMVLFGFIIQLSDIVFLSRLSKNKSLFSSVLFIYCIGHFSKYSQTSFVGMILDTSLMFPIFILVFIKFVKQVFFMKYRTYKVNFKIYEKNSKFSI